MIGDKKINLISESELEEYDDLFFKESNDPSLIEMFECGEKNRDVDLFFMKEENIYLVKKYAAEIVGTREIDSYGFYNIYFEDWEKNENVFRRFALLIEKEINDDVSSESYESSDKNTDSDSETLDDSDDDLMDDIVLPKSLVIPNVNVSNFEEMMEYVPKLKSKIIYVQPTEETDKIFKTIKEFHTREGFTRHDIKKYITNASGKNPSIVTITHFTKKSPIN